VATGPRLWADPDEPEREVTLRELAVNPDLDPAESTWRITAVPETMFRRRRLREQLELLDRPLLPDDGRRFELGSSDESDAVSLAETIKQLHWVRDANAEKLNWFERWRLREIYRGNYGLQDPTVPH
jgi:hypothetical protein